MFDFVQKYNLIIKLVLGAVALSFVGFGVSSYDAAEEPYVASVAGEKITVNELRRALYNKPNRPDTKQVVLNQLIDQKILAIEAAKAGFSISNEQLAQEIASLPDFIENGKFDRQKYERLLASQSLTPASFELIARRNYLNQQLLSAYGELAFLSSSVVDSLARLTEERREVSQFSITPEEFIAQVKVEPKAVKQYYEAHLADFKEPEQVKLEYVVFSQDDLAQQQTVTAEEIKKYYEDNAAQFNKEERRASHILLSVDSKAKPAEKAAMKTKAEQILQQVKANPARLGELAKQYSGDSGSAQRGGDLGYFGRGVMVEPFEKAVFSMKKGEVVGPVESEFGYHIIQLVEIKGANFEDAKPKIEQLLKTQKAAQTFLKSAEKFSEIIYQQADSLQPVIKELGLSSKQSDWVSRKNASDRLLNHPKLLEAVFSDDVLKEKHNTEAIEVKPNVLVAARVVEHKPAAVKPLDQVAVNIAKRLERQQAETLAINAAKAKLQQLNQGKAEEIAWSPPTVISRQEPSDLSDESIKEIFRAQAAKLPVYVGAKRFNGGYTLFKLTKVEQPTSVDEKKRQRLAGYLLSLQSEAEATSYVEALRKKYKVKIKEEALNKE